MKLSGYAKKIGVSYKTAWRWYQSGKIKGWQMDTGTIIITEDELVMPMRVAVYARVASSENKSNLDSQAMRLIDYCSAKGWQVHQIVKEIDSGVNDNRRKFLKLLSDETITHIVVEHKDRATRFGFNYIETLLKQSGRTIEVVNLAQNGKEDLLEDLVAIIHSFCACMYGQRRAKGKTERIRAELERDNAES